MVIFVAQYPTGFSLIDNNNNNNTTINHHLCRGDERQVLLQFKQQLSPLFPHRYYKTLYWNGSSDCCVWDGVVCDDFTGNVIGLDLNFGSLTGKLDSNSSLFHLTHLRSLNLAYNHFHGSTISSEFARLDSLTHLNLSHARFGGEISPEFYHLSNLVSLDLSNNERVQCDVKMVFGNMTSLRVLLLTSLDLSNSELPMNMSSFLTHLDLRFTQVQGEFPATLFEKPNLQILILAGNPGLNGSLPSILNWSNVHSIETLDLGQTSISGRLPDSIGFMTSLNFLRLSDCRFSGPIPESIGNITGITFMRLSRNEFSSGLPSTISNLARLTTLDLSHNRLEAQLPDAFSSLQNLTFLDLSFNNLQGRIPASLTNMSQLRRLDISSNALTGPFPSTAGPELQELEIMRFSNNSIKGTIPSWLFTLPSLEILDLSSNRLTGRIEKLNSEILHMLDVSSNGLNIELQSFYNLSSIGILSISHNTVTEHDDGVVNVTFPKLGTLRMSSCEITEFPNFLRSNMPRLSVLDLSNNSIHGQIPRWFPSELWELDLSANFLTYEGHLPWPSLRHLDLHSNSLRGTFPPSICNMSQLNALDFSNNKLTGNIPECLPNLVVLDLRRNEFHGKLPTTIGAIDRLTNLGLNGNHFEGTLPPSLANCTDLEVVDLGNNMLQDTFPWWLHTLRYLKILILKSNSFYGSITPHFTNKSFTDLQIFDLSYNNFTGPIPEKLFASLEAMKNRKNYFGLYMHNAFTSYEYSVILSVKGAATVLTKVLITFTAIDLSSNNFNGSIPESLSNLTVLRLLNLSHNSIHGSIPPALGRMTNLEQLDLSSNQLTGGIPQSLTNLTFLGALNFSHNHLVGPIPRANQFQTFSNESYAGNSGLCGAPLTNSCGNERETPPAEDSEDEEEEDGFMMGFTWKTVVIGYGFGTVLGFIMGYVMISMEKPKCLARFVYVEAAIILSRRKNKRRMVQRRR